MHQILTTNCIAYGIGTCEKCDDCHDNVLSTELLFVSELLHFPLISGDRFCNCKLWSYRMLVYTLHSSFQCGLTSYEKVTFGYRSFIRLQVKVLFDFIKDLRHSEPHFETVSLKK